MSDSSLPWTLGALRNEIVDAGKLTVAAQRQLIREQVISRAEGRFETQENPTAGGANLRGTMVRSLELAMASGLCAMPNAYCLTLHGQIERYYTELFSCDIMGKPSEDQYVHMHSNRLCVVREHRCSSDMIARIESS